MPDLTDETIQDGSLTPDEELDTKINAAVTELIGYIFDNADTDENELISEEEFRVTLTNLIKSQLHIDGTEEPEKKEGSGTSFKAIKQGDTVLDLTKIENTLADKSDIGHLHADSSIVWNSVEKNKAFLGPIDGEASEPTWRDIEVEDVPGMDKINDIATVVIPVNSVKTTVHMPDVKVQHPGQTTAIGTTTYNGITEDKTSFVRFEDSLGVYLGGLELLARPNGEVRLSLIANDPWEGDITQTSLYVASNDKISSNSHIYGVSNTYEFYKGIRPNLAYLGIRQGKETITQEQLGEYYQIVRQVTFADTKPKYTIPPIVMVSIHSSYAGGSGTPDNTQQLSSRMAGVSVTSCSESTTGFKINFFRAKSWEATPTFMSQGLDIYWVAFPGVYEQDGEWYQDPLEW